MLKRFQKLLFVQKFLIAFALCALGVGAFVCPNATASAAQTASQSGWVTEADGTLHWYENGSIAADKAFYDEGTNAWYWADADGTIATNKDVFIPVSNDDRTQGKWVRFDENSRMIKGEDCRYGGWYYFDETTGEMAKGFKLLEKGELKWVCYDRITGQMYHGEVIDSGNWYYFDEYTGATYYGFRYYPYANKWVCYDRITGVMYHGQAVDCGNWYYFDDYTGATQYGFKCISDQQKWVFYDRITGAMQNGEQAIDGEWYFLDGTTGAVKYGFHWISSGNKWAYYDSISGKMLHGTFSIGGKTYTFNTYTGALENENNFNLFLPSNYTKQTALGRQLANGQVRSVRAFADSILAGIGASDYAGLTWNWLFSLDGTNFYEPNMTGNSAGARLRSSAMSHGASFVGACIPNQGSMNFFSHLQNSDYGSENYAVVMLGTNDRGSYQASENLSDYIYYANNFISRLSSIYGGNIVVLSSIPVQNETYNYSLASANSALSGLCSSNGWAFASAYDAFEYYRNLEGFSKESCYTDGTHLNNRGQEILWMALQQLLEL